MNTVRYRDNLPDQNIMPTQRVNVSNYAQGSSINKKAPTKIRLKGITRPIGVRPEVQVSGFPYI
jgi:hypothetical protein